MNIRIKTNKQTAIMATAIMATLSAGMIIGINGQNLQTNLAIFWYINNY